MSTFPGFFQEFGNHIRADRFTGEPALYNLLSHAHSDHMVGLRRVRGFRSHLLCTPLTASWLSKLESAQDRVKLDAGFLETPVRPFRTALKTAQLAKLDCMQSRLLTLPKNGGFVKVTPIDANHCPGSCMFLLEHYGDASCRDSSFLRAVLYTGDIRAEPQWVDTLARLDLLKPYILTSGRQPQRRLEKIYLDTSAALNTSELLSTEQAIKRTLQLMSTWPLHTRFFLNVWTSGYEPFLLAVAKHFKTPVHVDRWKYALFKSYMTQENLLQCFTLDSSSTRFHACQRQFKCDEVWNGGRGCFVFSSEEQQQIHRNSLKIKTASRKNKLNVGCGCLITSENCLGEGCSKEAEDEALLVYVNPAEPFEASRYDSYQQELHDRLEACQQEAFIRSITKKPYIEPLAWPNHLLAPFSRHSTLPELQRLVALFQPHSLYPNTIKDQDRLTDYYLLAYTFKSCLPPEAPQRIIDEATDELAQLNGRRHEQMHPPSFHLLAKLESRLEDKSLPFEHPSDAVMMNLEGPLEAELEAREALNLHETWQSSFNSDEIGLLLDGRGGQDHGLADFPDSFQSFAIQQQRPMRQDGLHRLIHRIESRCSRNSRRELPATSQAPALAGSKSEVQQPNRHLSRNERLKRRALIRKTQHQKKSMHSDSAMQAKLNIGLQVWKRLRTEAGASLSDSIDEKL